MTLAGRARTGVALRAATAALAVALAGCAAIPTSGPITDGDVVLSDPGQAFALANDPPQDGSAQDIVNGFLGAGAAGLTDDFVVARKYLQPGTPWDPTARVLVYPLQGGGPDIEVRASGAAVVTVPLQGSVDSSGVYTEAPPDAREEIVLDLARNDEGQWRISGLDDVVLIAAPSFANLYRRVPVYFASTDGTQLVPDVRWFPAPRLATNAVRALLAGPSAWLRDAVITGAPGGTRLSPTGVTVTGQVAVVDLAAASASPDEEQRDLLQAQLQATLERLPGTAVTDVVVTADGGLPWDEPTGPAPARDVAPSSGPYVIADDALGVVQEGEIVPVEGVAALAGLNARSPALSLDERIRVVLSGASTLVFLPLDGEEPVELLTGTRLIAPSVDRFGWVWSGEQEQTGALEAVQPATGEVVTVAVDWLEGRTVRSLRLSRDGARIAVVHAGPAERAVVVDVAAVVRDPTGRPQRLSDERLQVGASLLDATQVAWVDEETVAVLGESGSTTVPTMHLVPVGGPAVVLPIVDGTVSLASGRGDRAVYVADAFGDLHSRQGASWVVVASEIKDPTFPG